MSQENTCVPSVTPVSSRPLPHFTLATFKMSVWKRISAFMRSAHVMGTGGSASGQPLSSRVQPFIRSTVQVKPTLILPYCRNSSKLKILYQITRRQLDHIASQRIRRTLASLRLHGQLWRSDRLARILSRIVRALFARMRRRHLLGLAAVASVPSEPESPSSPKAKKKGTDWESSRVPDSLMESHRDDLSYIKMLVKKTLTCRECGGRHVIEGKVEGVEYCNCDTAKTSVYGEQSRDGIQETISLFCLGYLTPLLSADLPRRPTNTKTIVVMKSDTCR